MGTEFRPSAASDWSSCSMGPPGRLGWYLVAMRSFLAVGMRPRTSSQLPFWYTRAVSSSVPPCSVNACSSSSHAVSVASGWSRVCSLGLPNATAPRTTGAPRDRVTVSVISKSSVSYRVRVRTGTDQASPGRSRGTYAIGLRRSRPGCRDPRLHARCSRKYSRAADAC